MRSPGRTAYGWRKLGMSSETQIIEQGWRSKRNCQRQALCWLFFASLDEETNYSNSSSSSTVTYRRYSRSSSLLPRQRQCTRTDFISACMADHAHFWVLSTHIRDHHAVRSADEHNICRNSTPFSSIYIRRTICIMRHRNQSPVIPLHCRCLDR